MAESDNKFTEKFAAVRDNTAGATLDLSGKDSGETGIFQLGEAFKTNNTITNVILKNAGVADVGARTIASILKNNTTITMLDLSNNSIGDEGAIALAEALKHNDTLTSLNLSNNHIGDVGMRALASAVSKGLNGTLLDMNLEGNPITDTRSLNSISMWLKRNFEASLGFVHGGA